MENEKVSIELMQKDVDFICACILLARKKLQTMENAEDLCEEAVDVINKLRPYISSNDIQVASAMYVLKSIMNIRPEGGLHDGE